MKMSQAMEKYMEQVNKLAALSDRVKLVPLNEWAQVVEVIEGNAATWPDEKFLEQFERYVDDEENEEGAKHKKADFMLFICGNCRGYCLAHGFYSNHKLKIQEFFQETNTTVFKLALFKLPKSNLSHITRLLGSSKEIKLLDSDYFKLLQELFEIFVESKQCCGEIIEGKYFTKCGKASSQIESSDVSEIPLNIPIITLPFEDISLANRLWKDIYTTNCSRIERLYSIYPKETLNAIQEALTMKSGVQRGIKLVSIAEKRAFFVEDLNKELVACQNKAFLKIKTALGLPLEKNKIEKIPEELNLLFCLQSIFKKLKIKNGFDRIAELNRTDAIEYIHSILPESPDDAMRILINNCNSEQIENWPSSELFKLFPLFQVPAKADADTSTFYRFLNVLLLESVYAYSPVLEKKILPKHNFYGEKSLANCVRLAVNNIQDLFEIFEEFKGIVTQKLYIPTENNEIKYAAALISAFCNVELSFTEPDEFTQEEKAYHLAHYALTQDRETISRCLFADIDRMEQYARPGLMILPRNFTYDDFFAPLWRKLINTGKIEKISDCNEYGIGISIAAEMKEKIKIGTVDYPYAEFARFFCLEPKHYEGAIVVVDGKLTDITEFAQFNLLKPIGARYWWRHVESDSKLNPIGDRIEIIENNNIPVLDTILIQPIDYLPNKINRPRFVAAMTELSENRTVYLRCQQLLPDYLAMVLEKCKAMIFWGTAPGKLGDAERIKRIKQICIPELSLKEQLRELFSMQFGKISESDSFAVNEAIDLRFKFDEAARRFLSEKLSPEIIGLMVNMIDCLDGHYEPCFIYNIEPNVLGFLRATLKQISYILEIMLPSMRLESLEEIERELEDDADNDVLIRKLTEFVNNEISCIYKDAGISKETYEEAYARHPNERFEIKHALAKLDADVFYEKERQLEVEKARAEERKKVIADMSHHIKNLVMSVIDPLELLREDDQEHQVIIDSAIRGAELIREIINAMNLSFSGSTEGVIYDFNHPAPDSLLLRDILISGLKNAVSNMFDGKYFSQFRHQYLPKDKYAEAKQQWQALDITRLDELQLLLGKYFFKLDMKLLNADIPVGNQNSSATKLLIMFQEIMLNAVKYTSFVPPAEREIQVLLEVDGSRIVLEVANTFNPKSAVKSSGLGQVIIKNFAALLGAKVDIGKDGGKYKIKIEFNTNQEDFKQDNH